jgi:hypothetical protein
MSRLLALFCLSTLACQGAPEKRAERRDAVASGSQRTSPAPSLYTRATLEKAVHDVLGRLGASVGILSIELFPDHARFQVESQTPGDVVEYDWRAGTVRGPSRLEIRGKGSLQQNLFLLSSVELDNVPSLVEVARSRVDAEQGVVSRVLIRRNLPVDENVGMRVYVDSPLRSSHVDADARGRPLDPAKYP